MGMSNKYENLLVNSILITVGVILAMLLIFANAVAAEPDKREVYWGESAERYKRFNRGYEDYTVKPYNKTIEVNRERPQERNHRERFEDHRR